MSGLTEIQLEKLRSFRDGVLLSSKNKSRERAKAAINALYAGHGLDEPEIIYYEIGGSKTISQAVSDLKAFLIKEGVNPAAINILRDDLYKTAMVTFMEKYLDLKISPEASKILALQHEAAMACDTYYPYEKACLVII